MEKRKIAIIGHKNPDTDSICSAICYSYLKNHANPGCYEPRRAGEINNETEFVLNYFKVDTPELLEDVNTQVMDIDYREIKGVSDSISVKNAWKLMRENSVVTLPIVKSNNKLKGLISINDIAKTYMEVQDSAILSHARTSYANVLDAIEGTLIVGNEHNHFVNGKVVIATANPDLLENNIDPDDIVIVGNRYDAQLCAIEMNAGCIIVCLNSPVAQTIKSMATKNNCSIITTPLDTLTVARFINQSIPIRHFMKRDHLVTFEYDENLDSVKEVMSRLRYRDFPILDDNGVYRGMVSRRNLLALRRKQVILVDHNEPSQAVEGIENAEIMEVIDHHRLGSLETMSPVYFRNQPVGCTATIIYQIYLEQAVPFTPVIAGLLCAAIISDTLMFRSPTCTELDRNAATALAKIAEIDIEDFASKMFEAGSDLESKTPSEIFYQDFKRFNVDDITLGVGQISSMNKRELNSIKKKIKAYIEEEFDNFNLSMVFFMLTNIIEQKTELIVYGDNSETVVKQAFDATIEDGSCILENTVSRKKQVIPEIVNILQQNFI